MQMLHIDEWTVDIQHVGDNLLVDKLTALWQNRESVRQHIRTELPSILEQASRTGKMIHDDYQQYRKKGG